MKEEFKMTGLSKYKGGVLKEVQQMLKLGEFDIYAFGKNENIMLVEYMDLSEYLIVSTYPSLIENPPSLFSHYVDCRKYLKRCIQEEKSDIILVNCNQITKISEFKEIEGLFKQKDIFS